MITGMAGIVSVLIALAIALAGSPTPVRVERGTMTLPTSIEGAPDANPPFDLFATRLVYPYSLRYHIIDRREPRVWRTLVLENEYLKCTVLPDLGGHLYTCLDKVNGASLFYANPSIKKANVSHRGAWAALGVEFNFPVSHSWITVSPINFATRQHPDGSASIVVGEVDQVYGGQWQVELTMRPGRAALEQHTTLYNRSDRRHRFYWWTNAAVRVWDDSRLYYPMTLTASHGFTEIDTWPVNQAGVDLSLVGNHRRGAVSLFTHGSRESFMGVYHPRTRAGVVHYSSPTDLPAKKVWSWGSDAEGLDWRNALSDDNSAYVEIQAGLFRNQETYAFLEPQQSVQFTEYWMPVRDIGGVTRATPEAVLSLARTAAHDLSVGLMVTRDQPHAHITVACGERTIAGQPIDLTVRTPWSRTFERVPGPPCRVSVTDAAGRMLLAHEEGVYDVVPKERVTLGRQPTFSAPPADARSDGDWLDAGTTQELDGQLLAAWQTYARGLQRYPASVGLHKAAGRLAVTLAREPEAIDHLSAALTRVSNDPELHYYLGLALLVPHAGGGDPRQAAEHFALAQQFAAFSTPARLALAQIASRAQRFDEALALVRSAAERSPDASALGAIEVALLRRLQRQDEARERVQHWRAIDPLSTALRYEQARLGSDDADLWAYLAGDADRVLSLAADYMTLGFFDDAIDLLARRYPEEGIVAEPGVPHPSRHPLVAYYRGYCRKQAAASGADADYDAAAALSTRYVFPHRTETFTVLRAVAQERPNDATARYLLGCLFMSRGLTDKAVREWEAVRRARPDISSLHRNLGLALLHGLGQVDRAVQVLDEGARYDATNLDIYMGLDQALSLQGASADARARALERYPAAEDRPAALVIALAIALAEAGRFDDAERLFVNRFFAREELGTNVRQVYLEVRLLRARRSAEEGRCPVALSILDRLTTPVPALPFTQDGLDAFVRGTRVQYESGRIAATCGDRARASRHFEQAASYSGGSYADLAFARRAAQALGRTDGSHDRLEKAAADARVRAAAASAGNAGALALGRGLLLIELGHPDDARDQLREALRSPDRMLSHHIAREALAGIAR